MRGLLNWKIGWPFTIDNPSGVLASRLIHFHRVGAIRDKRPVMSNRRKAINRRASSARCALDDPLAVTVGKWAGLYDYNACAIRFHCSELRLQISYVV